MAGAGIHHRPMRSVPLSPTTLPTSTTSGGRFRRCADAGASRRSLSISPRPPVSAPCAGLPALSVPGSTSTYTTNGVSLSTLALRLPRQLMLFRSIVTSTKSAPGPPAAWLGEVVVHSEDIRRPLGLIHAVPVEVATAVARFYARRDFTVASRSTIQGLRVEATDGSFASGDGPLVRGTTLALTMAMAGRDAYCDQLTGPGVPTVRARCSSSERGRQE